MASPSSCSSCSCVRKTDQGHADQQSLKKHKKEQQGQQPDADKPEQQPAEKPEQQPQGNHTHETNHTNENHHTHENHAHENHAQPDQKKKELPKFFTKEQLEQYNRDGFIVVPWREIWTEQQRKELIEHVDAMDSWKETPGKHMMYFEKNLKDPDGPKILNRIENFLQYDEVLNEIFNGERTMGIVSDLFGEPAVMYKEKINYKMPGGDGFKPHQDVAAGWWMYGQTLHISMLLSIDRAYDTNGALEIVRGRHKEGMFGAEYKEIPPEIVKEMKWEPVNTEPGDVVFFDSYVPHRSGPNNSDERRRVAYITYGKLSEGSWRTKYYEDKRKSFPPDCEREKGKVYEYKI